MSTADTSININATKSLYSIIIVFRNMFFIQSIAVIFCQMELDQRTVPEVIGNTELFATCAGVFSSTISIQVTCVPNDVPGFVREGLAVSALITIHCMSLPLTKLVRLIHMP